MTRRGYGGGPLLGQGTAVLSVVVVFGGFAVIGGIRKLFSVLPPITFPALVLAVVCVSLLFKGNR